MHTIYAVEPVCGSIDPPDQSLLGRGIPVSFAHTQRNLTAWRIRSVSGGEEAGVCWRLETFSGASKSKTSEMQPLLLACLGNLTLSRCQGAPCRRVRRGYQGNRVGAGLYRYQVGVGGDERARRLMSGLYPGGG
jgi:hypothetical protein